MPGSFTENELSLRDVLGRALDGLFILDRHRQFIMFSSGCERITGRFSRDLVGTYCTCHDVLECRDRQQRNLAGALCPGLQIFAGHGEAIGQRMRIRRPDGRHVWIETNYSALLDADGSVACVIGIMRDATDSVEREDELQSKIGELREASGKRGDAAPDRAAYGRGRSDLDSVLEDVERREILGALRRSAGQRTRAARVLRISRSRLYRRMDALGIDPRGAV
ncbi:MAG: helix-turn-helix domain-containing protein [Phycisphaerae bacterium]